MNTVVPTSAVAEFSLNDAVRLLKQIGDVPADTIGRVLGKFARPTDPTYGVIFVSEKVAILELRPSEIALVDNFHRDRAQEELGTS